MRARRPNLDPKNRHLPDDRRRSARASRLLPEAYRTRAARELAHHRQVPGEDGRHRAPRGHVAHDALSGEHDLRLYLVYTPLQCIALFVWSVCLPWLACSHPRMSVCARARLVRAMSTRFGLLFSRHGHGVVMHGPVGEELRNARRDQVAGTQQCRNRNDHLRCEERAPGLVAVARICCNNNPGVSLRLREQPLPEHSLPEQTLPEQSSRRRQATRE